MTLCKGSLQRNKTFFFTFSLIQFVIVSNQVLLEEKSHSAVVELLQEENDGLDQVKGKEFLCKDP